MNIRQSINEESFKLLEKHGVLAGLVQCEIIENVINEEDFTENDQNKILEQIKDQISIKSNDDFERWIENNHTSKEKLIISLKNDYLLSKHCQDNYSSKAKSIFLEQKDSYDNVIYSVIRVKDPFKARELYLQIVEDSSSFNDIASAYSEGPEADTLGVVGPTLLSRAHPKVIELLRTSEVGQIKGPEQVGEWHIITRLEKFMPAKFTDNIKAKLSREMFNAWLNNKANEEIKELQELYGS